MDNVSIKVENLGKQYNIGGPQRVHDRLTDQVLDAFGSPFRRTVKLLRGQASGAAELDETIWALRDVSFEVNRGEVLGIIGRNGAGKSTLLKILSRITEPSEGYADIYGRVGSLLEVGTGFHPELTGRENIYLNGAILGMGRKEIDSKFNDIVAFAEIAKFIDTPVKHYSSGMYVRLAFSVAAHLEPEILLVDEVLAVGDQAFQRKCLGKMEDVAEEGRTVLFVSHNLGLIQSFCERGIFLDQGQVYTDGSISDAVGAYLQTLEQVKNESPIDRTDRKGKGDVQLTGVNITNGGNPPSHTLKTGGPARFEFELNTVKQGLYLIFVIFDHLGQRITIFDSGISSPTDIEDPKMGNKIVCEVNELLLLSGRYRINVLIRDRGERQDFVEAAAFFDVEAGQLDGRPTVPRKNFNVIIPHRWTLPPLN
jgi:lipopolysaccharide transport system ATP-binding protein